MTTRRLPVLVLLIGLLAGCGNGTSTERAGPTEPDAAWQADVEREVVSLNAMRSRLAQTITSEETVDMGTFARVCKPVGQRARALSDSTGWVVQQIAEKYRNPANQLDSTGAEAHALFAANPDLTQRWTRVERNSTSGWRYYRRITVEPTCLACHGAKENRPDFVKQNYPDDKAYGFEAGDLRGLYAVFIPDSLRAAQPAGD